MKSELNKSDQYDLAILSKDSKGINKALEGTTTPKWRNPK